jgi:hypothetical protein
MDPTVWKRRRPIRALALAGAAALLVAGSAVAARPVPTLPADLPPAERVRLQQVTEQASVATRAAGEPFVTRRDVFEYLLDHPEFATHVTRALKLARYRIWREPDGLWLDDGWGATGQFSVVYVGHGTRVMYARGHYQQWLLPTIRGQAVVVLEYALHPAPDQRSLVTTTLTGFVKLDSRLLELAGRLVRAAAEAKAEREARLLVRVFARASRAIESDPAGVHELLRQRPDVPQQELEEFRRLLELR